MKTIQVAFFKAKYGGFFSKAIKWKTKSPYSHVEIIFPDMKIHDTKNNRLLSLCFSSYEKEGGVRFKFIHLTPEKWDILTFQVSDEQYEALMALGSSLADAKYDWAGIMGFVLPWRKDRPDRFFCSEVVLYVMQEVLGIFKYVDAGKTSPGKLHEYLSTLVTA